MGEPDTNKSLMIPEEDFLNIYFSTFTLFLLSLVLLSPSFAQDYNLEPILFSSKQDINSEKLTSSHFVYDSEDLANKTNTRAVDLLKNVPGVEVSQTGLIGGEASIFIRGAEGRHTLILIDGVKVFDPTSIGRTLNLSVLNTLDIEKIEVLKGSQSVLYGSDAIGGVINIITKKGSSKDNIKLSTGYYHELATQNTVPLGNGVLYLNAYYQQSKASSEVAIGDEKDFSETKGITLNHSTELGKFEFETTLKVSHTFSEADGFDFSTNKAKDDESGYGKDKHTFFKEGIIYNNSDRKKTNFDISYNQYDRKNKYLGGVEYTTDKFDGTILELEYRENYTLHEGDFLFGLNQIVETYIDDNISEKKQSITDMFFNNILEKNQNIFELGARGTSNLDFGNHLVYNIGWKHLISETMSLKLSNKTGFKAPSVYQQQAPATLWGPVGNKDLAPEKSNNYELAFEFHKEDILSGIVFFYTEVQDFIDYDAGYENVASLINRGVEVSLSKNRDKLNYGGNITLINYSLAQGKEVQRRPNFSLTTYLGHKISDQHLVNFDWSWKGRRFEYAGTKKNILNPYDLFGVDYIYTKGDFKLVTAVKNLFDRDYETTRGYSVLGRSLQLTLNYNY
jgi:vitamin B12 transporter